MAIGYHHFALFQSMILILDDEMLIFSQTDLDMLWIWICPRLCLRPQFLWSIKNIWNKSQNFTSKPVKVTIKPASQPGIEIIELVLSYKIV